MNETNVIIVGSGIAALQLARKLNDQLNVIILTKSKLLDGNSYKAQGGVAAAIGKFDAPRKHMEDTLAAGRYHNDPSIVKEMTNAAPALIKELFESGCPFDTDQNGQLLLGMEGAHSEKRIVHGGGDATGKRIMEFLACETKGIKTIENITVFDLLVEGKRCIGVKGKYPDGKIETFYGDHIVLATGGLGQIYEYTTNANTVTGDGIALAFRAGAQLADMEFVQFHPTLLYVNGETRGLISEAVRGEGAILVTDDGKKIMEGVHPMKDLAPRHVVAQEIYHYLRHGKTVYLDITRIEDFKRRFPTISALCQENGVSISEGKIPVAPGCHFLMGGVKVDRFGRTNIERLYAIGEVACTGVHGANRLASNSLLEVLFLGKNLADWINHHQEKSSQAIHISEKTSQPAEQMHHLPEISAIQKRMMDYVGIVRNKEGLVKQKKWLKFWDINKWTSASLDEVPYEQLDQVFMLISSYLVTKSALERTESRGGHIRTDFPFEDDRNWLKRQIIHRKDEKKDGKYEQIKTPLAT